MRQLSEYDVYIFDCDGVVLNSNELKISAMQNALSSLLSDTQAVSQCTQYFRHNFGKSRFHHVDVFVNDLLSLPHDEIDKYKTLILNAYSSQCTALYLKADITPNFVGFIESLAGRKYVASGSEQNELREVFRLRELDQYFDDIYGSPTKKTDLVSRILKTEDTTNAVMFGDAISDAEAADDNAIDFIFYAPYSNVFELMKERCLSNGHPIIHDFMEVTN